jgi:hypothetical protein
MVLGKFIQESLSYLSKIFTSVIHINQSHCMTNLGRTDTQIDTQIHSGVYRLAPASKNIFEYNMFPELQTFYTRRAKNISSAFS